MLNSNSCSIYFYTERYVFLLVYIPTYVCYCRSFKCAGVWKNMTICRRGRRRTTISHSSCESYVCCMYDIVLIIAVTSPGGCIVTTQTRSLPNPIHITSCARRYARAAISRFSGKFQIAVMSPYQQKGCT